MRRFTCGGLIKFNGDNGMQIGMAIVKDIKIGIASNTKQELQKKNPMRQKFYAVLIPIFFFCVKNIFFDIQFF